MIVRFSRSDAMSETYGQASEHVVEAEWFQITYLELRAAPDGESVAYYDDVADAWYVFIDDADGIPYSDFVFSDV